jgi:hypothetical protein
MFGSESLGVALQQFLLRGCCILIVAQLREEVPQRFQQTEAQVMVPAQGVAGVSQASL